MVESSHEKFHEYWHEAEKQTSQNERNINYQHTVFPLQLKSIGIKTLSMTTFHLNIKTLFTLPKFNLITELAI